MPKINLRDFYPWCNEDIFVENTEEMLEAMKAADRQQEAYRRRTYCYKAQFSLDCNDGMENAVLHHSSSPPFPGVADRRRTIKKTECGHTLRLFAACEECECGGKRVSGRPKPTAGAFPRGSVHGTLCREAERVNNRIKDRLRSSVLLDYAFRKCR